MRVDFAGVPSGGTGVASTWVRTADSVVAVGASTLSGAWLLGVADGRSAGAEGKRADRVLLNETSLEAAEPFVLPNRQPPPSGSRRSNTTSEVGLLTHYSTAPTYSTSWRRRHASLNKPVRLSPVGCLSAASAHLTARAGSGTWQSD